VDREPLTTKREFMTDAHADATAARPLVAVMGVSGSGKTTVGTRLAERLGIPFAEADDFHPPANLAKMASGVPLDDADRLPWLEALGRWLGARGTGGGLVTCSALRRDYRDLLRRHAPGLCFLHLDGPADLLARRLARRQDHFMPVSLLHSQLATLEPLQDDERGAVVDFDGDPDQVVRRAADAVRGCRRAR
jgi:gluconokinase